jgi:hypothetical protein
MCPYSPRSRVLACVSAKRWAYSGMNLNLADCTIRVQRTMAPDGQVGTPKVGHGRTVAMSEQLSRLLRRLQMGLPTRMKRHKWKTRPLWVFCTRSGKPIEPHNVRKVFRKCLTAARFPKHFTPPCGTRSPAVCSRPVNRRSTSRSTWATRRSRSRRRFTANGRQSVRCAAV